MLPIILTYLLTIPVCTINKMVIVHNLKKEMKKQGYIDEVIETMISVCVLEDKNMWKCAIPIFNIVEALVLVGSYKEMKTFCLTHGKEISEIMTSIQNSTNEMECIIAEMEKMLKRCEEEKQSINEKNEELHTIMDNVIENIISPINVENEDIIITNEDQIKDSSKKAIFLDGEYANVVSKKGDIYIDNLSVDRVQLETLNGTIYISNELLQQQQYELSMKVNKNHPYLQIKNDDYMKVASDTNQCKIRLYRKYK